MNTFYNIKNSGKVMAIPVVPSPVTLYSYTQVIISIEVVTTRDPSGNPVCYSGAAACWLQSDVAMNVLSRSVLVVPGSSKIEMLREITSVSSLVGENQ